MKPYPFQVLGTEFLHARAAAMLADDPGLGKTYQAIWACKDLDGPILVICRDLNKEYWRQSIRVLDPQAEIALAHTAGRFNLEKVQTWFRNKKRGYILMHHEGIRYQEHILSALGIWSAVIADEAHRFRNRKAQMTLGLKKIKTLHRWALTATPMESTPAEYWSILNWFKPATFTSYWNFRSAFCNDTYSRYTNYGTLLKGVKVERLDDFASTVAPYYLKRSKAEVAPQLPPKIYKNVPVLMSDEQERLFKAVKKSTFVQLSEDKQTLEQQLFIRNALARYAYLRKVSLDPALIGAESIGTKAQWIREFAEETPYQFVVFAVHREWVEALPALFPNGKAIFGGVPSALRAEILREFISGKLQYIVGTLDTMSESINLQVARIAVFAELHRSSIVMRQAEDRIHRIDTVESPTIITLESPGSTDELARLALEKKMGDVELVETFLKYLQTP